MRFKLENMEKLVLAGSFQTLHGLPSKLPDAENLGKLPFVETETL